ncbi:MAG TPA: hypothetical protein VI199_12595 [Novosphingobium sp.]
MPQPISHVRALAAGLAVLAAPALARDNLGVYGQWGAFRDPAVPRCYAIAMADPSQREREIQPYAAIGSWPRRGERGQVYLRLSRRLAPGAMPTLTIDSQRFALVGNGTDSWTADKRMDAAVIAAMRSARSMRVAARDQRGRLFGDSYALSGAATAIDAATVGCARS